MQKRAGFTLVELVVVILILGILASVAAPSLLNQSRQANDNSARTTLAIVRDAIEIFAAQNGGAVPGNATLAADLQPLLRGADFPTCPVGRNAGDNDISNAANTDNSTAWRYIGGQFFINDGAVTESTTDDAALTYDQL